MFSWKTPNTFSFVLPCQIIKLLMSGRSDNPPCLVGCAAPASAPVPVLGSSKSTSPHSPSSWSLPPHRQDDPVDTACLRNRHQSQPSASYSRSFIGYHSFFDDTARIFWKLLFMSLGTDIGMQARQRKLPDPTICRAQTVGFGGLVKCLVVEPAACPFALDYGAGYFCKNPDTHKVMMGSSSSAPQSIPP